MYLLFQNNSKKGRVDNIDEDKLSIIKFAEEPWFIDLQKLSNDELMRMYNTITTDRYEFAKNAWYIPLAGDKRCKNTRTRISKIHRRMGFWIYNKTYY